MSLFFTNLPRQQKNPAILYFVVSFKTEIKMEDQKHGEDQLEYCSGSSTGITQQHISGVSVKKSRKVSKMDIAFGF